VFGRVQANGHPERLRLGERVPSARHAHASLQIVCLWSSIDSRAILFLDSQLAATLVSSLRSQLLDCGGIAAFPLLEAFPYESLKDVRKRYAIPLVVVLWAGIYNAPLMVGVINLRPDDIFFFDFLFLVAYVKSRNSIGLVLAYVLAESPIWYIIAMSWGVRILSIGIVVRALLSVACVGILVFQYWRSRGNDQKSRSTHI